tara:strand:- start:2007 stop:2801 length:795 start_codon:yes stop_codon:yes gene_type:complete
MNLEQLKELETRWETEMGKAFLCERAVMRGKDIHHELTSLDWFRVNLFSITGREFSDKQMKLLNFIWVATSYPDPSIWPNHVASLAGTVRSTSSLGMMAGLAISEASIYGRIPERKALDFFYRTQEKIEAEQLLENVLKGELEERGVIYGYGRPLAKIDERIPHTIKLVEELGFDNGKYYQLALSTYQYLKVNKGLSMNIAAINTALIADMGFSTEEYQQFMSLCFVAGITPCYIDARNNKEGSFFPVRCESIVNNNQLRRNWD